MNWEDRRFAFFSIRAYHINERLGLEWRRAEKHETKSLGCQLSAYDTYEIGVTNISSLNLGQETRKIPDKGQETRSRHKRQGRKCARSRDKEENVPVFQTTTPHQRKNFETLNTVDLQSPRARTHDMSRPRVSITNKLSSSFAIK
ncbi:hypothetical protein TNCV_1665881 [Trichonephila clavipes]|nr:hypothetical protein TNCV_1665881 [Trichonephila clavipes]